MMEYQVAMEQFLYSLHCDLWNISHLEPSEFVLKAQGLISSGLESQVIGMLKQAIIEYRNDRAIMKYMYIIDKLLKIGSFAAVLQNFLVELYTDIFISLLIQKCNNEIEEIKILRKFWVGSLHPILLARLREAVLAKTNIDLDLGFKNQTLTFIRNYYTGKLQMTQEEVRYHLPQLQQKPGNQNRQLNNASNKAYLIDPVIAKVNPPVQQYQQAQKHFQQIQQLQQAQHIQKMQQVQKMQMQEINLNPYPYAVPMQQSPMIINNALTPRNGDKLEREEFKRQRFSSQQTKLPIPPLEPDLPSSIPRKQVHKNEELEEGYVTILRKISEINRYLCKQCGMSFLTKEKQEKHTNEHFKEKLNKADKGFTRKLARVKLMGRAEWVEKQNGEKNRENTFCISMSSLNQSISEYKCDFCSDAFQPEFKRNQWVFSNSVKVDLSGKQSLMHKTCQLAFQHESSSSEEENKK